MAETRKDVATDALVKLIGESGILNPNVKIADLLTTSLKAAAITHGATPGGLNPDANDNLFIHSGYVFLRLRD